MPEKTLVKAKVIGQDGNVFVTLGICVAALKSAGFVEESKEMKQRVFMAGSYENALTVMMEYCEFVDVDAE